jgi:hypothetical protein
MEIDLRDEQFSNAVNFICLRREFGSNVTVWSEIQNLKQFDSINSTAAGMQMTFSDKQLMKSPHFITRRTDLGSNVKV